MLSVAQNKYLQRTRSLKWPRVHYNIKKNKTKKKKTEKKEKIQRK